MQQSMISMPKYCWRSVFQCEVTADLFFLMRGIVHKDFIQQKQMVNEDFYTDMFKENLRCDTMDTNFSTTILLCEYFWSITP